MRAIALDVGDKTIGIAVSDPLMMTAQGIETIERIGIRKDADKVLKLIREMECTTCCRTPARVHTRLPASAQEWKGTLGMSHNSSLFLSYLCAPRARLQCLV